MLKSNLLDLERLVTYRDLKSFSANNLKTSLDNFLGNCSTDNIDFEYIFTSALNECALKKKISFGGNHKSHLNKKLAKKIMLKSTLKNKAKKTKSDVDIAAYKEQGNYFVSLNQISKYTYLRKQMS